MKLSDLLTAMLGPQLPVATVLRLLPILAPLVTDLADGDTHLSEDTRLSLQQAIENALEGDLL